MPQLVLFPLNTVLFPGGELRLRIFEPRYLELVRDCTRDNQPFGVCRILRGHEVGEPAAPAAFGTAARIVDFNVDERGLLGIVTRGERRFHVERPRLRDNGLLVAEVSWIDPRVEPMRPEHSLLSSLLERMLEQAGGIHAMASHAQFDDAEWVGFRLCELLPLDDEERQRLLQEPDPHDRLQRLLELLPSMG